VKNGLRLRAFSKGPGREVLDLEEVDWPPGTPGLVALIYEGTITLVPAALGRLMYAMRPGTGRARDEEVLEALEAATREAEHLGARTIYPAKN
jgi:hypothetical protein